jgi:DNA-binding MarR family transcriptional regulator
MEPLWSQAGATGGPRDQSALAQTSLNDDMTHGIEALDLTPSRTHLLWELGQRGPVTQRVLADALKVTPRAVTGLVDALAESGFVTREPHPADRRATLVTSTPEGKKVIAKLKRDHRALARALFDSMSRRASRRTSG